MHLRYLDDRVRIDLVPLLNRVLLVGVIDRTFSYFNERVSGE